MFANASPERKAVYFSVIGEPPIKMLRYQQQYSFFDAAKIGDGSVRFIHLGQQALDGGLAKVLERSCRSSRHRARPSSSSTPSGRWCAARLPGPAGETELTDFMQRLALALTSHQATTFLLGEYGDGEHDSAVFTVADGLLWLYQAVDRNSVVRKLQVMKMRGQGQIPGLHTARITDAGYNVFPRILKPEEVVTDHPLKHRLKTGVPALDKLMAGGIPRGYSVLVAGPSGSGKTVLSNQFIVEGISHGENGIVAVFEKRPNDYLQTTPRGEEFEKLVRRKKLEVLYLRPLDLSIDETLLELREAVKRTRRQAGGDRFAVRPGAGARADLPRGLPRIAVSNDGSADRPRRHGDGHRRAGRLVRRSPIQPPGHRVSHGRHHHPALHRDRRGAEARDGGRQGARQPAQQGAARVRHHLGRGDRRWQDAEGIPGPAHGDTSDGRDETDKMTEQHSGEASYPRE